VNWVHYVHAAFVPRPRSRLRRWKSRLAHARAIAYERAALGRARLIVSNSEKTKRDLIQRLGVAAERIRTVYYGTDAGRFLPASPTEKSELRAQLGLPNRPLAVFIGSPLDLRKGFDLIEAAWL